MAAKNGERVLKCAATSIHLYIFVHFIVYIRDQLKMFFFSGREQKIYNNKCAVRRS